MCNTGRSPKVFHFNLYLALFHKECAHFYKHISLLSPFSLKPLKLDRRESICFYNHSVYVDIQEIAVFCSKGWLMYSPTHRALPYLSLCCSSHLLQLDGFPSQVCPQEHLGYPFPVPSPPCRGTIQWWHPGGHGGYRAAPPIKRMDVKFTVMSAVWRKHIPWTCSASAVPFVVHWQE